jgi:hypothetical protein
MRFLDLLKDYDTLNSDVHSGTLQRDVAVVHNNQAE